jgi:hypothetical protein
VKNLKYYLLVLGLGMLLLLPLNTRALTIDIVSNKDCKNVNGTCTETANIYATTTSTETNFNGFTSGTLTLANGITGATVAGQNGFTATYTYPNTSISIVNSTGYATAGQKTLIAVITLTVSSSAADCSLTLTPAGFNSVKVDIEETTTTTTKTGASLPYVILGCGAVAALAIYTATKKQTKLHKI